MMDRSDRVREFILGLTELTRKTGIVIGGCGCCDSPYVEWREGTGNKKAGYALIRDERVCWLTPEEKYDWADYSDQIVRREE